MGYAEALKDHGKALVVDPRGYGDSSRARTEADYSLDASRDDHSRARVQRVDLNDTTSYRRVANGLSNALDVSEEQNALAVDRLC